MKAAKLTAFVLALGMTATMLTGCGGGGGESGDTIRLGGIAPLTGGASDYGIAASNGLKLAIKEINEQGGVLGKQVELVGLEDDENDPTKSVNAYNKLSGQKIDVLWGPVTSKPTISVAQKTGKEGLPMITPTATAPAATEGNQNVFRACFLDPTQGKAMAAYAQERLSMTKVAVLFDNADDYSIGVAETFKAEAESRGMTVTAYESFTSGDTDFKSQLSKIKGTAPEGLFVPSYYNTDALIAIQAKELGLEATLLGADGWDGVLAALDVGKKDTVDGLVFSSHFFSGSEEETVKHFVESYRAEYGSEPTSFAALGYDAAHMLFDAIERAGSTDKAAVISALGATQYSGVTGSIHYEGSGDPVKTITMLTIEDGAYKQLENFDLK